MIGVIIELNINQVLTCVKTKSLGVAIGCFKFGYAGDIKKSREANEK